MSECCDRAIVQVLREFKKPYIGIDPAIVYNADKLIAKHSPKPKYCRDMRSAIDSKLIIFKDEKYYFFHEETSTIRGDLHRCPSCPDGSNCLEVKE